MVVNNDYYPKHVAVCISSSADKLINAQSKCRKKIREGRNSAWYALFFSLMTDTILFLFFSPEISQSCSKEDNKGKSKMKDLVYSQWSV